LTTGRSSSSTRISSPQKKIAPESIDLVVTSPPCNVDIKYSSHNDQVTYNQYLAFSRLWMKRCYSWLKDDGQFCLSIPLDKNKGGPQESDISKKEFM
jgi:site-specific DNA-methyltransferase (adenine-specific)